MNFKRTFEYIIHAFRPFTVDNMMKRIESDCKWLEALAGEHLDVCEDERVAAHCASVSSDRHHDAVEECCRLSNKLFTEVLH